MRALRVEARAANRFDMKFLPVVISVLLLFDTASAAKRRSTTRPCDPLIGDAIQQQAKDLNRFKNRTEAPSLFDNDPTITIDRILAPGNDVNRFSPTKAARITGYVASVKVGGIETCNCHASDPAHRDTHIDVVADPKYTVRHMIAVKTKGKNRKAKTIQKDANEKHHVIVEVTPRVRDQMRAKGID